MAEDMTRFTRVDEQIDPRIFITFLDAANALEDLQSVKRLMIAQLELRKGLRVLERAENAHDITATMSTLGRQPRYVLNEEIIDGHEAIRAAYEGIGLGDAAAFSHFKVEVTGLHAGEEAIVLEGMMSGTHVAEWQGVPATGRSFHIPVCAVFTFDAEEKLAGERIYFDSGLLLKQLGVLS